MKNSKVLFLTSLLAITTLAGCGTKVASSKVVDDGVPTSMMIPEANDSEAVEAVPTYPDEILLNHRVAGVVVGKEFQISPIRQFKYDGSNLQYEMKDPTVASVTANGLIKGLKGGSTELLVSDKTNPELKTVVPVYVAPTISNSRAQTLATQIETYEQANPRNAFTDKNMYRKTISKKPHGAPDTDYVSYSFDRFDERMTVSVDDAYLRIWETDEEIRVENGSSNYTNYEWIFQTNAFYDTTVFHQTGDVKNYFVASTQEYMKTGDRTLPLFDILDNMFTGGREVFTNELDNAKASRFTSEIAGEASKKVLGSNGDGDAVLSFSSNFSDVADIDDESRYGIPYGTNLAQVQDSYVIIKNNKIVSLSFEIKETYTADGYDYLNYYQIERKIDDLSSDKKEIYVPNKKDYNLVDRLFAV